MDPGDVSDSIEKCADECELKQFENQQHAETQFLLKHFKTFQLMNRRIDALEQKFAKEEEEKKKRAKVEMKRKDEETQQIIENLKRKLKDEVQRREEAERQLKTIEQERKRREEEERKKKEQEEQLDEEYQINVLIIPGFKNYLIKGVKRWYTAVDLKAKIACDLYSVLPQNYQLSCKGSLLELEDGKTLQFYDIFQNATVVLRRLRD